MHSPQGIYATCCSPAAGHRACGDRRRFRRHVRGARVEGPGERPRTLAELGSRSRATGWRSSLRRGADAAAAFFGVLAAGAVAVIVNELLRPRQIEHVLEHSGASRAARRAGDPRAPAAAARDRTPTVIVRDAARRLVELRARAARARRRGADHLHLRLDRAGRRGSRSRTATSGPAREAVIAYLGTDRRATGSPACCRSASTTASTSCSARSATGAALVVERSPVAARIVRHAARAARSPCSPAVPPLWLQLLAGRTPSASEPLPALRVLTNTGGRLPVDAVRALRGCQPQAELVLMYGLTEAFRSTYLAARPGRRQARLDRPGDPGGRGPRARRRRAALRARARSGELVHRGPTVALGYWNDPEATARVFRPNPLRAWAEPDAERVVFSGDLVYRDEDGDLFFVGREDAHDQDARLPGQPRRGGRGALRLRARSSRRWSPPSPTRCAGSGSSRTWCCAEDGELERLEAFAAQELPRYMQPARIEVRDELRAHGERQARRRAPPPSADRDRPPSWRRCSSRSSASRRSAGGWPGSATGSATCPTPTPTRACGGRRARRCARRSTTSARSTSSTRRSAARRSPGGRSPTPCARATACRFAFRGRRAHARARCRPCSSRCGSAGGAGRRGRDPGAVLARPPALRALPRARAPARAAAADDGFDLDVEAIAGGDLGARPARSCSAHPGNPTGATTAPTSLARARRGAARGRGAARLPRHADRRRDPSRLRRAGRLHERRPRPSTARSSSTRSASTTSCRASGSATRRSRRATPSASDVAAELVRWTRIAGIATPTALMQRALPRLLALRHDHALARAAGATALARRRCASAGYEVAEPDGTLFVYVAHPGRPRGRLRVRRGARDARRAGAAGPGLPPRGYFRLSLTGSEDDARAGAARARGAGAGMSAVRVVGDLDRSFAWDGERLVGDRTTLRAAAERLRGAAAAVEPAGGRLARRCATRSASTSCSGRRTATAGSRSPRARRGWSTRATRWARSARCRAAAVVDLAGERSAAVARAGGVVRARPRPSPRRRPAEIRAHARPLPRRARGARTRRRGRTSASPAGSTARGIAALVARALPGRRGGQLRPRRGRGGRSEDRAAAERVAARPRTCRCSRPTWTATGCSPTSTPCSCEGIDWRDFNVHAALVNAVLARGDRATASAGSRGRWSSPATWPTSSWSTTHAEQLPGRDLLRAAPPRARRRCARAWCAGLDTCHREVGVFEAFGLPVVQPYAVAVDAYLSLPGGLPRACPTARSGSAARSSASALPGFVLRAAQGPRPGRRRRRRRRGARGLRRPRRRRDRAAPPLRRAARRRGRPGELDRFIRAGRYRTATPALDRTDG